MANTIDVPATPAALFNDQPCRLPRLRFSSVTSKDLTIRLAWMVTISLLVYAAVLVITNDPYIAGGVAACVACFIWESDPTAAASLAAGAAASAFLVISAFYALALPPSDSAFRAGALIIPSASVCIFAGMLAAEAARYQVGFGRAIVTAGSGMAVLMAVFMAGSLLDALATAGITCLIGLGCQMTPVVPDSVPARSA